MSRVCACVCVCVCWGGDPEVADGFFGGLAHHSDGPGRVDAPKEAVRAADSVQHLMAGRHCL